MKKNNYTLHSPQLLKEHYAEICEEYGRRLNELWETDGEWINDYDGRYSCFDVADCFVSNFEIRYIVDNGIGFDDFEEWYYYDEAMRYGIELGKPEAACVNIDTWFAGYPDEKKVPKETRKQWQDEYFRSAQEAENSEYDYGHAVEHESNE